MVEKSHPDFNSLIGFPSTFEVNLTSIIIIDLRQGNRFRSLLKYCSAWFFRRGVLLMNLALRFHGQVFAVMLFSVLAACDASTVAGTSECMPLNERLSFCTALENGSVGFMGATPGYVGALTTFVDTVPERSYPTIVRWDVGASFEAYARAKRDEFRAGRSVSRTKTGVTGGFPSIRYDFAPGGDTSSDFLIVLDTGAGYAMITGAQSDRTSEDIERIARLLKVSS